MSNPVPGMTCGPQVLLLCCDGMCIGLPCGMYANVNVIVTS